MIRRFAPSRSIAPQATFGFAAARWCATQHSSKLYTASHEAYVRRHIGPTAAETTTMLASVAEGKFKTTEEMMNALVPSNIRRKPLEHFEPLSEHDALNSLRNIMLKNKERKSLIGQGYFEAVMPPAIQRYVLENPQWYTPYTPYQAEISQGRLESLLNFQTTVTEITGMELANASLLDEATAAFESVSCALAVARSRNFKNRSRVIVHDKCFASTIEMIRTRAEPMGMTVEVVSDLNSVDYGDQKVVCILGQSPDCEGTIHDFSTAFAAAKAAQAVPICGTDLLASTLTKTVAAMGAEITYGSAQRFGVPLGFGGPHAAFFATLHAYRRFMAGRIIGVTIDSQGRRALRMALQTREQHIKRENATSNICTAQALLANIAAMYALYHGPEGLKAIANRIHNYARLFATGVSMVGHRVNNSTYFDTVTITLSGMSADDYVAKCNAAGINVWRVDAERVSVSMDEATRDNHVVALLEAAGVKSASVAEVQKIVDAAPDTALPAAHRRTGKFMQHEIFHKYTDEPEMMRYIFDLTRKDYGLQNGMIPLGSCTMKLNAAATMLPLSWSRVTGIHPLAPVDQSEGYQQMAQTLRKYLADVSGFDAVSLQPNSGAQGEYAGLRVIRAYHASRGESHRNLCLIPQNAHGTNPATAALCGLKQVTIKCLPTGEIDMADLEKAIETKGKDVAAMMITYPSTYGVFDVNIAAITEKVHSVGAQVYIDGANFNAMVGHTGPGFLGGDVCHFNLHKTFSIPHGGGGPGMGPIGCREHLAPFLPCSAYRNKTLQVGGAKSFGLVAQAPLGSASILNISYMLITMLGSEGMKLCTDFAVLNANYMMFNLMQDYKILFRSPTSGLCAHEFIIDIRPLEKTSGVKAEDVAKRLIDYGFHPPTLAFPVAGTLMVEPTESEPKSELDRFINAMRSIRKEIAQIEAGTMDKTNNPLKNAPHCAADVINSNWNRPYSRELAAFPTGLEHETGRLKFWPAVSRINNEFGDMNLFCTCPPPVTDA